MIITGFALMFLSLALAIPVLAGMKLKSHWLEKHGAVNETGIVLLILCGEAAVVGLLALAFSVYRFSGLS
jgi:hypothetical protein